MLLKSSGQFFPDVFSAQSSRFACVHALAQSSLIIYLSRALRSVTLPPAPFSHKGAEAFLLTSLCYWSTYSGPKSPASILNDSLSRSLKYGFTDHVAESSFGQFP